MPLTYAGFWLVDWGLVVYSLPPGEPHRKGLWVYELVFIMCSDHRGPRLWSECRHRGVGLRHLTQNTDSTYVSYLFHLAVSPPPLTSHLASSSPEAQPSVLDCHYRKRLWDETTFGSNHISATFAVGTLRAWGHFTSSHGPQVFLSCPLHSPALTQLFLWIPCH